MVFKKSWVFNPLIAMVLLFGCDDHQDRGIPSRSDLLAGSSSEQFGTQNKSRSGLFRRNKTKSRIVRPGTDEFLGNQASSNAQIFSFSGKDNVSLNLVRVPIKDAAKAILGDALGVNYTIADEVSGTITIQTTQPIVKKALLSTFETILESKGLSLQKRGDILSIISMSNATRRVTKLGSADQYGARVVAAPLRFISAAEMVRLLRPIVGQNIILETSDSRNILLISGTKEEINSTIDTINLFDVDVLKGKSTGIFKLRAADPETVAMELERIFESQNGGSLSGIVEFIPNQKLRSILVITSRVKYLRHAENWIRDLDSSASGISRRPVVYPLENRSAEGLAPILADLTEKQQISNEGEGEKTDSLKIIADNDRNAIVVFGNDEEQENVARLIASLDTVPVQVLIEATIAEVTLTDELNYGLQWYFENGKGSGTLSNASNGAVGANFPGLSLLFKGTDARVALNALANITDVNVISSPSLMVLDNQEAVLQIGDEVPIATQQVTNVATSDATIVNTISFRDTGILLRVKPRISSGGRIILDIEQEVSSVKETTTSGIDSPTISQRKIKTKVAVNDSTTLALGGLIQDNHSNSRKQIPVLGDVPVLGNLFKSKSRKFNRTELLILITPKVIRDGAEAVAITNEFRNRLQRPNRLIKGKKTAAGTHGYLE